MPTADIQIGAYPFLQHAITFYEWSRQTALFLGINRA